VNALLFAVVIVGTPGSAVLGDGERGVRVMRHWPTGEGQVL
jgi:hypothetical protein